MQWHWGNKGFRLIYLEILSSSWLASSISKTYCTRDGFEARVHFFEPLQSGHKMFYMALLFTHIEIFCGLFFISHQNLYKMENSARRFWIHSKCSSRLEISNLGGITWHGWWKIMQMLQGPYYCSGTQKVRPNG